MLLAQIEKTAGPAAKVNSLAAGAIIEGQSVTKFFTAGGTHRFVCRWICKKMT
jgi:hypothetical protein